AEIGPGKSGGALIEAYGNLLGISTAVLDETGASIGIGFAIPADSAMKSLQSIIIHGKVVRGSLGLSGRVHPLREEYITRNKLEVTHALLVEVIEAQGPAHSAGIKPGDLITHFNQRPIGSDGRQALNLISDTPPGTTVSVTLMRGEAQLDVDAIIGVREPGSTRT